MLDITGGEDAVFQLFNPSSIAIIGASAREGALSWWPLRLLSSNGYQGKVYAINPARSDIDGHRCFPSLREIDGPVDLAVIALNADRSMEAIRECAERGVKTVVLPTQGFGEMGSDGAAMEREMAAIARAHGMRIVGPNTDGVANLASGAIASIQPLFDRGIESGPVGLATQSGATASSLLVRLKHAGIGCRFYASAGNESDLGLADYLSFMIQDPNIRMVLSFVETLRRPQDFAKVADLAAELGKPIALIKVGRSEQGAKRAAAHTGALAGADQLYDSLFASKGVMRVNELSELVAIAKFFLGQGAPKRKGLGIVAVSGGQAGALADKAGAVGLPVPTVSEATENHLNEVLKFGKGFNPCDLTGEVAVNPSLASQVYESFGREPEIGSIVYARKHLTANAGVEAARLLAVSTRLPGAVPLAVYAMDGSVMGPEAKFYQDGQIPVFDNLNDLYMAVDKLAGYSAFLGRRAPASPSTYRSVAAPVAPDSIAGDGDAKALLSKYGVRFPQEILALNAESAVSAAQRIGYPVVMKIVSRHIQHKTEAGGVALGVKSPSEAAETFTRLTDNARRHLGGREAEGVLIQEQIQGGSEIILGLKVDAGLGAFVVAGLGGIFTELLRDVAIRPAPVDADTALRMLEELRGIALLRGFRGAPAGDIAALAETIVQLSRFGADQASWLGEADLNPVLVLENGRGVRVVDVLLVPRER
jgi:acetate---CoA ligase (ADP-forming)